MIEYAEFFFSFVVESFVGLDVVLLGFSDYKVVFFCSHSWFFYDEVGGCGVVGFHGFFHGFVCGVVFHFDK